MIAYCMGVTKFLSFCKLDLCNSPYGPLEARFESAFLLLELIFERFFFLNLSVGGGLDDI